MEAALHAKDTVSLPLLPSNFPNNILIWLTISLFILKYKYEHTYLESGHSYLPNDSDFGKFEGRKEKVQFICTDSEWAEHIQKDNLKEPFKVIRMKGKILDFKTLRKALTFCVYEIEGNSFCWMNLMWFHVAKRDRCIHYKITLDPNTF